MALQICIFLGKTWKNIGFHNGLCFSRISRYARLNFMLCFRV